MIPVGLPLAMTCAQRPGKKASSEKKKNKKQKENLLDPQARRDK